jgi:hypothetical protein
MVEKELRARIQGTVQELREIKRELDRRYSSLMKTAKPLLLVAGGYFGLKVGLWVLKGVLSLAWKYSLLFVIMVGFLLMKRLKEA